MAMLIRMDKAVSATIRQSETAPSVSDVATASVIRDEATDGDRPLKPAALGDRFMVGNPLLDASESPADGEMLQPSSARLRQRPRPKMAEWTQVLTEG